MANPDHGLTARATTSTNLALSGAASHVGEDRPVALCVQIAHIGGGSLHAAVAILAALAHRSRTGEGASISM